MSRFPFHWTPPYTDHLLWLWAVKPELPRHEIASRLGISTFTLKVKQDKLQLPRRTKGRRTFGQATLAEIVEDDAPIDSSQEDSRESYRNQDASDRLLDRLRKYHDVTDLDTVTIKAAAQTPPSWPFQLQGRSP